MLYRLSVWLIAAALPGLLIAAPSHSTDITQHQPQQRDVNTYAIKYKKNCIPKNSSLETEAWDSAQKLAKAAQLW